MKPKERFSNRVEEYRRYRPGYPLAVIDLIRETCGLKAGAAVADIGSGTGIFTRRLLQAAFEVTGVEPNDAMRKAAEEDLRSFPNFHSVDGAAEQTGLPDAAFEVITVAQAFHWFDPLAARLEFSRILRPGGSVFIIRNQRQVDSSPFAQAYDELLKTLGQAYTLVAHRDHAAATRNLQEFFAGGAYEEARFDNPHVMDWEGLRGRFLSSSYAPSKDDPRREEYVTELKQIFDLYALDDHVTFDQQTEVYYGKLS